MFLSYLTLAVAISLSVIAAYYSIAGLTAIFAAAVVPIIIMGSVLELAKVVATLWLHEYWDRCKLAMKAYLVPAVVVLMVITSMGIFGFLSKAHSDQSLVSGDVLAKISIYDEKINVEKENITTNRAALKQLDEAVDQIMGRSADEKGADKAVAVRRSQSKERSRLLKEIEQSQQKIATLNEQRAPIAAEVRKVEAEVGPIKYIAALVYGDNPDSNLLEKAVRWVIILLVTVFDPLAIMMLLAATESIKWERNPKLKDTVVDTETHVEETVEPEPVKPTAMRFVDPGEHPQDYDETLPEEPVVTPEKSILEQHPYLAESFVHFENLKPIVAAKETVNDVPVIEDEEDEHPLVKAAQKSWKEQNPGKTLKEQRNRLARGEIKELPWMALIPEHEQPRMPETGFGTEFPAQPEKGDVFVRTDKIPTQVFKFNGTNWILVDKNKTDNYTYNDAYIEHLISKIDSGEYDPDLLTNAELEQIQQRFRNRTA